MTTNTEKSIRRLKNKVMFRVYTEYVKNVFFDNLALICTMGVLGYLGSTISLSNIFHNMPKDDPRNTALFMVNAVKNTKLVVQIVVSSLFISSGISSFRFLRRQNFNFIKFSTVLFRKQ